MAEIRNTTAALRTNKQQGSIMMLCSVVCMINKEKSVGGWPGGAPEPSPAS